MKFNNDDQIIELAKLIEENIKPTFSLENIKFNFNDGLLFNMKAKQK